MRRIGIAASLAFLLAGCSGGDGGDGGEQQVRAKRITGPIVGMIVASGVDKLGRPVDPTFTFSPEAREIAVLVAVGKVTGSPLTIAWFQGETKLFEHTVEVSGFEIAFSTGRNPGQLAPGTYRAAATLEGKTTEIEWEVADGTGAPAPAATGAARVAVAPVPGDSGVVASTVQGGLADNLDDPGAREYWGDPRQYFHGDRGCVVALFAVDGTNLDYEADTVDVRTGAEGCEDKDFPGTGETVVVTAGSREIASYPAVAPGTVSGVVLSVDPCSLPGGSDLPGAMVPFRVKVLDYPVAGELSVTLGDDTLAPRVRVTANPSAGEKVDAGDQINVEVVAEERRRGGPWQTGVQRIQVTGPDGLVGEPKDFGRLPKKCGAKQLEGEHEVTYTVPSDPPPEIELCAIAEDFAGNEQSSCGTFYTGEKWTATIRVTVKGPTCTGVGSGSFQLGVAAGGSVRGRGRSRWDTLAGSCAGGAPRRLRISGTRTEDSFALMITSLGPDAVTFPVTIPIRGTTARATFRPGGGQTVTYDLKCETCGG